MDANLIAGLGRSLFGVLVAVLRPMVRDHDGAVATDSSGRRLLPLQRGTLTVDCADGVALVTLDQVFTNSHSVPLRLACTMALPATTVVADLVLRPPSTVAQGRVDEQRTARAFFSLLGRTGQTAALLSEDAPDVISQEVSGLLGGRSLRTVLRFAYRLADTALSSDRLRMAVHFDASANARRDASAGRRLLRLGEGHRLDSLFGIGPRSSAGTRSWMPRVLRGGRAPAIEPPEVDASAVVATAVLSRLLPTNEGDVLVSSDRPDYCGAAWRSELAGRRVRVVASVRPAPRPSLTTVWSSAAQDLSALMRRYVDAGCAESERRDLAARITDLGLRHRLVTLWTSLIATPMLVQPGDVERSLMAANVPS